MASRILGFVLEETPGEEAVEVDTAVLSFGLLDQRDEEHPSAKYQLGETWGEDVLAAQDLVAGMINVKFVVRADYVHAWPFILALGKLTSEGGGIYTITTGTRSANSIPSFTVYSQCGDDVVVVNGCKVKELKFHLSAPRSENEKPENAWFELEIWGLTVASHAAITADPQVVDPTGLANTKGKGWDMVPVKTYSGETLSNLIEFNLQVINQLVYHAALGTTRVPRGLEQLEGTIIDVTFANVMDFTANDLQAAARTMVNTWAVGADNDIHLKLRFNTAGTEYHQIDMENVRIVADSGIKSARGMDEFKSMGKPMYDGTNKALSLSILDGATYALV